LWGVVGGGIAIEGSVLGGRRRAAAHRYGAHIGSEGYVGDGRVVQVFDGAVRCTGESRDAA
jgi:hypothetical protein